MLAKDLKVRWENSMKTLAISISFFLFTLTSASNAEPLRQFQDGSAPMFLDIAKNADGSVKRMKQSEAFKYCANQGAHLPTARELAQLSISLGARGIVEWPGMDEYWCRIPGGFYSVRTTNDIFCFSSVGFQRPAGDLGNHWFWSSSYDSNPSFNTFVLNGFVGEVDLVDSAYSNGAVLCVSGR